MVEWDGLENRCGLRSTEGSNPSLPAEAGTRPQGRVFVFFLCFFPVDFRYQELYNSNVSPLVGAGVILIV